MAIEVTTLSLTSFLMEWYIVSCEYVHISETVEKHIFMSLGVEA